MVGTVRTCSMLFYHAAVSLPLSRFLVVSLASLGVKNTVVISKDEGMEIGSVFCNTGLPLRYKVIAWGGLIILLSVIVSACDSAESHFEKAKAMVGANLPTHPTPEVESKEVLDLRSADIESERYLPVLERLERRQETIRRVLSKQSQKAK